jgi:predicted RNase H-like nuclease (RuvC/YqgF family)
LFATHEQAIREYMKSVRTQEEKLDILKHRRKGVVSKADSAERKLSKLDPGHKNTPAQTELLMRLREEIRELDSEIMTEETKLGDLKRTAAQDWMSLKFGGLQECCRKGLVSFSRLVSIDC